MDRRAAKELLHMRDWLLRAGEIVARGKDEYLADELLQEAGDSLTNTTRSTGNRPGSRCPPTSPSGTRR